MKKLFVVCFFMVILASQLFSQNFAIDKGAMMLGGLAEFSSEGRESSSGRSTEITIYPTFDIFIIENLFIGGTLGLFYSSYPNQESQTAVSIGPEIGYSFGTQKSTIYPFIKGGFSYFKQESTTGTIITLGGGLIIEVVKHFGLVGFVSYNLMNTKSGEYSYSSNTIKINFGFYGLIY